MEERGRIHQLSTSPGGVPKRAVRFAEVDAGGLRGDRQADARRHGGLERAVVLYALERIDALRAQGHPLFPGSVGENVTLAGVDWERVTPGVELALGRDVRLRITDYTAPCAKQARWFRDGDFGRLSQFAHPGWSRVSARVLRGGTLRTGDPVRVLPESLDARAARQRIPALRWRPPRTD